MLTFGHENNWNFANSKGSLGIWIGIGWSGWATWGLIGGRNFDTSKTKSGPNIARSKVLTRVQSQPFKYFSNLSQRKKDQLDYLALSRNWRIKARVMVQLLQYTGQKNHIKIFSLNLLLKPNLIEGGISKNKNKCKWIKRVKSSWNVNISFEQKLHILFIL